MTIRAYKSSDLSEISTLFYETVHETTSKDYTKLQQLAWANGTINRAEWDESFRRNHTLVAVLDKEIVGFGDMENTGYLDRLYVHKDHQNRGIGSEILDLLEQKWQNQGIFSFNTYASITARPFFESRGYTVLRENVVIRQEVSLTNFYMEHTKGKA